MKKITLLVLAVFAFTFNYAQDTCAAAATVTPGVTETITTIDGTDLPLPDCAPNEALGDPTASEWYVFTASLDGIANVTSDLASNVGGGADTRLHIYTGSCGSLTCVTGADDVDFPTNAFSDATFPISNGTTYYIAWDNQWGSTGFDFLVTETAVDCGTTSPYFYDFSSINPFIACYTIEDANSDGVSWGYNNGNDFDGDTVNDPVGLIFPPNPTVTKDDWLFLPVFSGVANADYAVTLVYNVFDNPVAGDESFEIVILDAPNSGSASQNVIGSYSGITQAGAGVADLLPNAYSSTANYSPNSNGDFYIGIHLTTPQATSAIFTLFSIEVTETLSLDEFNIESFSHYYDKSKSTLNLESSDLPFNKIEVYSLLGQNVLVKELDEIQESIDIRFLNDGMYLARVNINGNTETFKFIKN